MIIAKVNKELKIICKSDNINFLQTELEGVAYSFVKEFEIVPFVFHKKSRSGKWGNVPKGYFMTRDRNKINIFNKIHETGWIYSAFKIVKIATFYLIKPTVTRKIEIDRLYNNGDLEDREDRFMDVHGDIKAGMHPLFAKEEVQLNE